MKHASTIHSQQCRSSDQVTARRCCCSCSHIVSISWSSVRVFVMYLQGYHKLHWSHELLLVAKELYASNQSVTSADCFHNFCQRPFMPLFAFVHEQHDVAHFQRSFLTVPLSARLQRSEVVLTPLTPKLLMHHLQVLDTFGRCKLHARHVIGLPPWASC